MNSLRRVQNLETLARRIRPPTGSHEFDEDEWLVQFEQYYENGLAADEPDYPIALDGYREALVEAHRQGFDPPATFRPEESDRRSRAKAWRTAGRYPDVSAGWDWLSEFVQRGAKAIPPVTEAEFHALGDWFAAHEDRLRAIMHPSHYLELGAETFTTLGDIRWQLAKGPRVRDAGELAETIRRIRQTYAEQLARDTP